MSKFLLGAFNSVCSEYGLCLVAFKDGHYVPSGTAVMVGPGIAMTALHVVQDYFMEFDRTELVEAKTKYKRGSFDVFALHPESKGEWKAQKISFHALRPDIAYLFLEPNNDVAQTRNTIFATLNLNPPAVGEEVFAYGFVEATDGAQTHTIDFGNGMKRAFAYSGGVVKEVHDEYRDKGRLTFPCFHTNARFDGGMSGGPVFNLNKEVIGLVCSSLPPSMEHEEHVSYASLLWPSMLLSSQIQFAGDVLPADYPILFLAQKGIMSVKGWEKCELSLDESGSFYKEIRRYHI